MTRKRRLIGWKAICGYLECSRSTARDWRENRGLPIHRSRTGRPFARPCELEQWFTSRPSSADTPQRAP